MKIALWLVIGIATAAALVIVATPFGIELYAERWLRGQGIADPVVRDVDLNPFTGTLRLELVTLSENADRPGALGLAELNIEWTSLFGGRVLLSSFTIADGEIDIQQLEDDTYSISGLTLPLTTDTGSTVEEEAAEGSPWEFGIANVSIENVGINYRDERFDSRLDIQQLTVDRLTMWDTDTTTRIHADAALDGAQIGLRSEIRPFAEEPTANARLIVERFSLAPYSVLVETATLEEASGLLSLDLTAEARYRQEGPLDVRVAGTATLESLMARSPLASLSNERLSWSGDLAATVPFDAESALGLSGTTELALAQFSLRHPDRPIDLITFDSLSIGALVVQDLDRIELGQLSLNGLNVLTVEDTGQTTLAVAGTSLGNISFNGRSALTIEQAKFDGIVARITRNEAGELTPVSQVIADFTPATEPAETVEPSADQAAPTEETALAFHIDLLEAGGESRLIFRDASVAPPVAMELGLNALRLKDLGNIHPDRPTGLAFDFSQKDSGTLVGEGEIRLFGQLASDVKVSLEDLDLTQLSSYVPAYHIQRGRLSVETTAILSDDKLDVSNSIVLNRLQLSGKQGGEQGWLGTGMAMPLDVALDLLRDGDDRIALKLPITGSLSDPEFGTGDIVRRAMQGALQKAALSYAKNALQPLGTIMLAASIAGQAARPRFDPLIFEPGSAEITAEGREYLAKISQLLEERPGLSITFCGVSSLADREAFLAASGIPLPEEAAASEPEPEQAAELPVVPSFTEERQGIALERGGAVQEYLQTSKRIDASRLFRCRPMVLDEAGEQPRVEISL